MLWGSSTGKKMKKSRDRERGATLVEAAIAYGLLFLAIFAVVEFGLAFKDWLSVSHASRDGARAGATFGDNPNADILILREAEGTLAPIGLNDGDRVRVYRANGPSPSFSNPYTYRPGTGCDIAPGYTGPPLAGCCDWSPCPEVGRDVYVEPIWEPQCRDISAPITDRIGVEIAYSHAWATGFFGTTTDFTTATEFQIEPQIFDNPPTPCN
jgi:hypothetical protein